MKKYSCYLTICTAVIMNLFFACTRDGEPEVSFIVMAAMDSDINIYTSGAGAVTVDWGDGSNSETKEPDNTLFIEFSHKYSEKTTHIITITGNNINGLGCAGNRISNLDVSNYAVLQHLDCSNIINYPL